MTLRLCSNAFSTLGVIFGVRRIALKLFLVKSVPKIGRQVGRHHRGLSGGYRSAVSSGLIPKEVTYV